MAIFKSLHFGENIKGLKGVVRYNSLDKKGFNSKTNPRLISVLSNVGYCDDVSNKKDYEQLTNNFITEVQSNALLSSNKRQKYLYEHSIISFSEDDDHSKSIEKLTEIAEEISKEANPNNAPMLLWPQVDSGKLHFHLVRGLHDDNGNYQKNKDHYQRMNKVMQKIEIEKNLTLTGKNNPENFIWKTANGKKKKVYIPQQENESKVSKNKKNDFEYHISKTGKLTKKYKEIKQNKRKKTELLKKKSRAFKNKSLDVARIKEQKRNDLKQEISYTKLQEFRNQFQKIFFKIESTQWYLDKKEREREIIKHDQQFSMFKRKVNEKYKKINNTICNKTDEINYIQTKIEENENKISKINEEFYNEELKNKKYSKLKDTINNAYRKTKTAEAFLKILNENNIEAKVTYRKNGAGGLSFNDENNNISIAAGKVNSHLTFGKIKKNDPDLFALLTGKTGIGTLKNTLDEELKIFNVNKKYKEKINNDGSVSLFFFKKDIDKYPHNHNLKINAERNAISLGYSSNKYDLKLAYDLAKKNKWSIATSEDKDLILKSMAVAYSSNKDDLFFFQTKEPTLTIAELTSITGEDISLNNLIKLHDKNIIKNKDEMKIFVDEKLKEYENYSIIKEELKDGKTLKKAMQNSVTIAEERLKNQRKIRSLEDNKTNKITRTSRPTPRPY